jgi:hypothetical protein
MWSDDMHQWDEKNWSRSPITREKKEKREEEGHME